MRFKRQNFFLLIPVIIVAGYFIIRWQMNQPNERSITQTVASTATTALVQKLEEKIQNKPQTVAPYLSLASAYLQVVRETADASYYIKAEDMLSAAEKIESKNPDIIATRAAISNGRHDFLQALNFSREAVALNPARAAYYGLVVDNLIELGQYEEAVTVAQTMVDLSPDYSSYVRIAHLRELHGDIAGAIEAINDAIAAGSAYPENIAWVLVERGKLELRTDMNVANASFGEALASYPKYPPALEGQAKVAFFKEDTTGAIAFAQQAFDVLPIAQYATLLGDLYAVSGQSAEAEKYYLLTEVAFSSSKAAGINTDLEEAQFLADHHRNLEVALTKAKAAHAVHPTIFSADTLAWIYYQRDQATEAQPFVNGALRLGKFESSILYHAGLIKVKTGDPATGKAFMKKALELHPRFSILQVSEVKKALAPL